MTVTQRAIAQHYRRDGRPKVGYETMADLEAHRATFTDPDRDPWDPELHPYRCGYCELIHVGHVLKRSYEEERARWVNDVLRDELGIRVLSHLGAENFRGFDGRLQTIRKRCRRLA